MRQRINQGVTPIHIGFSQKYKKLGRAGKIWTTRLYQVTASYKSTHEHNGLRETVKKRACAHTRVHAHMHMHKKMCMHMRTCMCMHPPATARHIRYSSVRLLGSAVDELPGQDHLSATGALPLSTSPVVQGTCTSTCACTCTSRVWAHFRGSWNPSTDRSRVLLARLVVGRSQRQSLRAPARSVMYRARPAPAGETPAG